MHAKSRQFRNIGISRPSSNTGIVTNFYWIVVAQSDQQTVLCLQIDRAEVQLTTEYFGTVMYDLENSGTWNYIDISNFISK